jgi:hypothetical protein
MGQNVFDQTWLRGIGDFNKDYNPDMWIGNGADGIGEQLGMGKKSFTGTELGAPSNDMHKWSRSFDNAYLNDSGTRSTTNVVGAMLAAWYAAAAAGAGSSGGAGAGAAGAGEGAGAAGAGGAAAGGAAAGEGAGGAYVVDGASLAADGSLVADGTAGGASGAGAGGASVEPYDPYDPSGQNPGYNQPEPYDPKDPSGANQNGQMQKGFNWQRMAQQAAKNSGGMFGGSKGQQPQRSHYINSNDPYGLHASGYTGNTGLLADTPEAKREKIISYLAGGSNG